MDNNLSNFSPLHSGKQKRGWRPRWRDMTACLQLLWEAFHCQGLGKQDSGQHVPVHEGGLKLGRIRQAEICNIGAQPQVITLSKSNPRSWVTLLNLNSACLNLTYIPVASYLLPPHLNLAVVLSIPAEMPSETPCLEALGMRLTLCFITS